MSKFQNRYRVESTRLQGYDYGKNGAYFVTICTKNRKEYFGEIIETPKGNFLQPTVLGRIAIENWNKIPHIFPFIRLDEFTLMPNHLHGVLIISKPSVETHQNASPENENENVIELNIDETHFNETHINETHINASLRMPNPDYNETHINASLQELKLSEFPAPYRNKFGPQSQNLSSVLRGFKGAVKAFATINRIEFTWQARFYDHIIRDEKEFEFIRDYIRNNPKNWKRDRNNEEGLYF